MAILKKGSSGAEVKALQVALNALGYNLSTDGIFGAGTDKAVRMFQLGAGLGVDGMVGPKTLYAIQNKGEAHPQHLGEVDFLKAAQSLQCELAAVKAVNQVESKGTGFTQSGMIKILFERHKFYKYLKDKYGQAKVDQLAALNPDIINVKAGGYVGGDAEHARLNRAIAIDEDCAYMSVSSGLYQIMGFNHEVCGYPNAKAMYDAFVSQGEGAQLAAFVLFIKANPTLLKAIRNKDWATFALNYNGPAYKDNNYDVKMANAYASFV